MKKKTMQQYARLLARTGLNVQKGQEVLAYASIDQPDFVRMVVEECYRAGASRVEVEFSYTPVTRAHYRYRTLTTLSRVEKWELERLEHRAQTLPCRLFITSDDPDALKGLNMEKISRANQAVRRVTKPYRDRMENRHQWCIAAVPGKDWAKKIFPDLKVNRAMEKLWEAILTAARADGDDPIGAWERHNADLHDRCAYLNGLGIKALRYRSATGTDFRVELMDRSRFAAGTETTLSGVSFNPNIPSEEVFTSPMKGKAEGWVYATMPLSYQGVLIENFAIRFEGGRAVEVKAEKNEDVLRRMIGMDEGAAYLGECALVPYTSPIKESGILFYETLFDENAVCHLALGAGFPDCIEGFESMTHEECIAAGMNESIIHVDFMIGAPDLSIDAETRDGRTVPLFRDGVWAF